MPHDAPARLTVRAHENPIEIKRKVRSAAPARPSLTGRNLTLDSPLSTRVRVRVPPRSWRLYRHERRGDAPPRGYVEAKLGLLDRTRDTPPCALFDRVLQEHPLQQWIAK